MQTASIAAVLIATAVVGMHAPSAEAGRGTASLKYLSDTTNVVVLVDVAKGRKSPVFNKGFELAVDKVPQIATLQLDKNVDTLIAGQNSTTNESVLVIEGKVTVLLAEAKKRSTGSATHAGVTYFKTPEGEVAVLDKRLVVASTGAMDAVIDRAADKKRTRGPANLRTWLAAGQPSATVVMAAMPDANMTKDLAKRIGGSPQFVTLSVAATTNLTADLRMQFADEATAETTRKELDGLISTDARDRVEAFIGKDFADSLQIDRDGTLVRGAAVLTADEIDKVLGLARMFM